MKAFDPWTATFEDAEEASLYDEKARSKWAMALYVTGRKSHFEQHPIDGIANCLKTHLSVPQWLSDTFLSMFEKFENLTVATLDEAFCYIPKKGKHLSTQRLERQHGLNIQIAFMLAGGPARTLAGRKQVAEKFGLTEKQVRTLLQKTRSNVRGHKPYGRRSSNGINANDPFSIAHRKIPKK